MFDPRTPRHAVASICALSEIGRGGIPSVRAITIAIAIAISIPIHHLHPVLRLPLTHMLHVGTLLGRPPRRQEIHEESKDVKSEDERDDPLKNSRDVLVAFEARRAKHYRQQDFHNDEGELGPEGEAQDAMLAEVHAEALVFGADEDGADDVACDEEEEEAVVEAVVVQGVEDGEEN